MIFTRITTLHYTTLPGPCGIPGLIPGSRFILDPDPDPGKLFSEPGSGSKPGFAFLFNFGQHFYILPIFGSFWKFSIIFSIKQKKKKNAVIFFTFGHFWSFLVAFGNFELRLIFF